MLNLKLLGNRRTFNVHPLIPRIVYRMDIIHHEGDYRTSILSNHWQMLAKSNKSRIGQLINMDIFLGPLYRENPSLFT
jgi:hypothetical protein